MDTNLDDKERKRITKAIITDYDATVILRKIGNVNTINLINKLIADASTLKQKVESYEPVIKWISELLIADGASKRIIINKAKEAIAKTNILVVHNTVPNEYTGLTCPHCFGKGTNAEGFKVCDLCKGLGIISNSEK